MHSVANIFFGTGNKYECIHGMFFFTWIQIQILGMIFLTKYKYKYICSTNVDQIQIFQYFWLKYLNIIIEKYYNILWNNARGHKTSQKTKLDIMLFIFVVKFLLATQKNMQLCSKHSNIQEKFMNVQIYSCTNFLLILIFEYIHISNFWYSYWNIRYLVKIFEYVILFEYLLHSAFRD